MKFLLINTNQIVQKLVEITAKKAGVNLTTITESKQLGDLEDYDYILVDDDCFNLDSQTYTEALKNKRKCLIYNKQAQRTEGFDDYVQKPFLPTSILDIFTAQLNKQAPAQNLQPTSLDLADSALGAELDAALNGGDLNTEMENTSIGLDNLTEGLEEIDHLLDESLEDTQTDSGNVIKSQDIIESSETQNIASEDSQTIDTQEQASLIEETGDEPNTEATLDDGLDINLDLSNLDELSDDENTQDITADESLADLGETAESTEEIGDLGDLDNLENLGGLEDLGALEDLVGDESKEDSKDSAEEENMPKTTNEDELNLDELSNDEMDDIDELALANLESQTDEESTETSQHSTTPLDEEFSTEGLLENDLLDDVEGINLDEPVLDEEQVSEVSKALQAIGDENKQDFASLKEPQIAQALGEEIPEDLISQSNEDESLALEEPSHDEIPPSEEILQTIASQPQEIVKNMIASSVQSSISNLSSNNLKTMLDGLEVTINISFKDKSK